MSWKPVLAGVDGSEESVRAAEFAILVAERTGAECQLVHAVPEYWTAVPPELGVNMAQLTSQAEEYARQLMARSLTHLPAAVTAGMISETGRAPLVLCEAARKRDAAVVILGGKHHRALGRLAGSTVTHLVRLGGVGVLAHTGDVHAPQHVLAAVDRSPAAAATIREAGRWAAAFQAKLRVLHMVEPLPVVPGANIEITDDEVYRSTRQQLGRDLQPILPAGAELTFRRGRATAGIVQEALIWKADLIVVSSHGKSWMDRLTLGSTSERLLHVLPAPVLILPARQSVLQEAGGSDSKAWLMTPHAA